MSILLSIQRLLCEKINCNVSGTIHFLFLMQKQNIPGNEKRNANLNHVCDEKETNHKVGRCSFDGSLEGWAIDLKRISIAKGKTQTISLVNSFIPLDY